MTAPYKILIFLKRRPGMSVADFRAYYETRHVPLVSRYLRGVSHYVRRYVTPLPLPETGEPPELECDVITELWFTSKTIYDALLEVAARGDFAAEIIEDELRVFDRPRIRYMTLTECESTISPPESR
ncbi:MAG: hypothetical protein RL367_1888 [Pseudomonadota bacterium]